MEVLLAHRQHYHRTEEDWVFANPETDKPYHQDPIQQSIYARPARMPVSATESVGTRSGIATGQAG